MTYFNPTTIVQKMAYKINVFFLLLSVAAPKTIAAIYITEVFPKSDIVGYQDMNVGEFIELTNSADTFIALNEWSLHCGVNIHHFSESDSIAPHESYILPFSSNCIGNAYFNFSNYFLVKERIVLKEVDFSIELENYAKLYDASGMMKDSINWDIMTNNTNSDYIHPSLHRDSIILGCNDSILSTTMKIAPASPGKIDYLHERNESSLWVEIDKDSSNILKMHFVSQQIGKEGFCEEIINPKIEYIENGQLETNIYSTISIHPNPVVSSLNITSISTETANSHFTLQDDRGMILRRGELDEEGDSTINMEGLRKGNYILYIEKEGNSFPFKICKE